MGRVRSRPLRRRGSPGPGERLRAWRRRLRGLSRGQRIALGLGLGALALLALLLVLPGRIVLALLCAGVGLGMLAIEVRWRRRGKRLGRSR